MALIIGNWKMNGTRASWKQLAHAVISGSANLPDTQLVVCPPMPALADLESIVKGSRVQLGAQAVYADSKKAHTGQISAEMLPDFGVSYVLAGHSEHREDLGLTSEDVGEQVRQIIGQGMHVVLCIGETRKQRESGNTLRILDEQLRVGIEGANTAKLGTLLVVAYEPIWAIGGDQPVPNAAEVEEVFRMMRKTLIECIGEDAEDIPLLYGGSANADNIGDIANLYDVAGVLAGTASLDAQSFMALAQSFIEAKERR